jgi:hypothetical protein
MTRRRKAWLLAAILVVITVALTGGLVARVYYAKPSVPTGELPTTSLPPAERPGPPEVKLSPDTAAHPLGDAVRTTMRTNFDAINARNFAKWSGNVTSRLARNTQETAWTRDYRSTRTGSIQVHRIDAAPDGSLRVLVSFVSTQNVADAPDRLKADCIRWNVVYPLAMDGNRWKIDSATAGSSSIPATC